jgi:Mg2+ and Co2+ transporter CorA
MMDSIVDTFFPLIDFIETESDDIDSFLANPLSAPRQAGQPSSTESNRARRSVKKPSRLYALKIRFPSVVKTPSLMQFYGSVRSVAVSSDREASFSSFGRTNKHDHDYVSALAPRTMGKKALRGVEDKLFERSKMLKRIAESRKLIQGLSRLLTPKTDVVRGLRKRIKEESISLGYAEPGQRHDIGIYLGDLQGELAPSLNNMQAQIALTTAQIIF